MLCLSRKKSERIVIGKGDDTIVVTVVEIRGGKVRLGFESRKTLPIHREEILAKIREGMEAARESMK